MGDRERAAAQRVLTSAALPSDFEQARTWASLDLKSLYAMYERIHFGSTGKVRRPGRSAAYSSAGIPRGQTRILSCLDNTDAHCCKPIFSHAETWGRWAKIVTAADLRAADLYTNASGIAQIEPNDGRDETSRNGGSPPGG